MEKPTSFDPYYIWLGIPSAEQPPDYYRLLGLQRFESRPEVVRSAYSQRKKYIASFSRGPFAEIAQKIYRELKTAHVALCSPELRELYDEKLLVAASLSPIVEPPQPQPEERPLKLSQTQPRPIAQGQPMLVATMIPTVDLTIDDHDSALPSRQHSSGIPKKPNIEILKILLGSIGGLTVGFVVLCVFRPEFVGKRVAQHEQQKSTTKGSTNHPLQPRAAQPDWMERPFASSQSDNESTPEPDPNPLPVFKKRPPGIPPLVGGHRPEQKPDEFDEQERLKNDFDRPLAIPVREFDSFYAESAVELPKVGDGLAVQIANVTRKRLQIELVTPEFISKKFKLISDGDNWVVDDGDNKVARFYRDGAKFLFAWEPDAPQEAACLRNAVVALKAGIDDATIALRKPKRLEPMTIDFTKREMNEALDAEFLCGLKPILLRVEMVGLTSQTRIERYLPIEKQAPIGKQVLAFLRTGKPEVAIAFGITSRPDGISARVVATPQYCVDGTTILPFTADRVKSIARSDVQLAQQLHSIAQPINESKGALRYRVYYMVGPHEVTLIDASSDEAIDDK